jgi:hypothetical protein
VIFGRLVPVLAVAAIVVGVAALVALSLRQPTVATYAPTASAPRDAGGALVGPVVYTVDATAPDAWRQFSFRLGSVVDAAQGDLAFRRYSIVAGLGAGIRDLGETPFEAVRTVPPDGYLANESHGEPRNPAIASWYRYGFFTHVLSPKPRVWAVRTAEGRYAKMQIVGYYCPGAEPGCLTFRYVYQGDGSTVVDTGLQPVGSQARERRFAGSSHSGTRSRERPWRRERSPGGAGDRLAHHLLDDAPPVHLRGVDMSHAEVDPEA